MLAVLVLGALWFLALRPHSQSSSSPPAPAPAPAPAPTATSQPQGSSLPGGLGGLARAVNKANGAVATSQANANQLERNSAAASSSQAPAPTSSGSTSTTAHGAPAGQPATASGAAPSTSAGASTSAASATHAGTAAGSTAASHGATNTTPGAHAPAASPAVAIKNELADGKTVALLFWNPLGVDDRALHSALLKLTKPHGSLVVHFATAAQVPNYGTIVTASQVLETPTLLLMRGKDIQSITDLQDPSDLRQYVNDIAAGGAGAVQTPKLTSYAPGTSRVAYLAKVNAACARANNHARATFVVTPGESLSQLLQAVEAIDSALVVQIARVQPPLADRAFVRNMWALELRSQKQFAGYVSASAAGNAYAAHNLVLSAEINDDRAAQMALTYGLTDCVAPSAR